MTINTREQIEQQGYGLTGEIGGIRKQKYFTPDGREVWSIPCMREWQRKNGKGVETGIRDANLDKGWTLQPPQNPQLQCPHCDKWHKTQEEVDACGAKRNAFDSKWMSKAQKDTGSNEIEELKSELDEVKALLKQLLEKEKK